MTAKQPSTINACPKCGRGPCRVIDSGMGPGHLGYCNAVEGAITYRKRLCRKCKYRFITVELPIDGMATNQNRRRVELAMEILAKVLGECR